jgi:uncharacterized membrane protein
LVENCGTTNPDFLVNLAGSLLGYICVAVGIVWRLKDAFQCSTWLPLYYSIVYNALCYSGVDGVWAIAATQFMTRFMTCVILTFRCVFFDLKIEGEEEDGDNKDEERKNEKVVAERYQHEGIGTEQTDDNDEKEEKNEKAVVKVDEEVHVNDDGAQHVEEDKRGGEKNWKL